MCDVADAVELFASAKDRRDSYDFLESSASSWVASWRNSFSESSLGVDEFSIAFGRFRLDSSDPCSSIGEPLSDAASLDALPPGYLQTRRIGFSLLPGLLVTSEEFTQASADGSPTPSHHVPCHNSEALCLCATGHRCDVRASPGESQSVSSCRSMSWPLAHADTSALLPAGYLKTRRVGFPLLPGILVTPMAFKKDDKADENMEEQAIPHAMAPLSAQPFVLALAI